ncbi:MAG: threonine synthase [Promethearchaeota archaeon]
MEYKCPECNGLLFFKTELSAFKNHFTEEKKFFSFWDYNFALPSINKDYVITLGEGGTPCKNSKKLGEKLGLKNLFFKDETHNPTNSFKDRAAALLISHARSWDYYNAVCASDGNQGASIAAYTSLEGMECVNIIPEEIDTGKRAQMIAYNSKIVIKGKTVDDAIKESLNLKYRKKYYQCTPEFNPLTIEGQKTLSFEIFNQIGNVDWVIIPMGSGGLLLSVWKGFSELKKSGIIKKIPKMVGVQSDSCSPIVDEYNRKRLGLIDENELIKSRVLSLMVRKPQYHAIAINAINESNGTALAIPKNKMLRSAEDLARNEGIFSEPASALTIAALNKLIQSEAINSDDKVVCLITGSGLKTPYVLEAISTRVKTAGSGGILSTKTKILSQISLSEKSGINGTKLKEIIGSISLPAIYQHLKELEAKNLISRKKKGKKVLCFITDDGKKVLEALNILIRLL